MKSSIYLVYSVITVFSSIQSMHLDEALENGWRKTVPLSYVEWQKLNKQLLNAVKEGKEELVKALLNQGANVNYSRGMPFVETPLYSAVARKNACMVALLIKRGAFVPEVPIANSRLYELRRLFRRTFPNDLLFSLAIDNLKKYPSKETKAIVKSLLNANISALTSDQLENLIDCINEGDHEDIRETLKENGFNALLSEVNGISLLHRACGQNKPKNVKLLIELGASIERKFSSPGNFTPLTIALYNGYAEVIKILLQAGASFNDASWRLLTNLLTKSTLENEKLRADLLEYLRTKNDYAGMLLFPQVPNEDAIRELLLVVLEYGPPVPLTAATQLHMGIKHYLGIKEDNATRPIWDAITGMLNYYLTIIPKNLKVDFNHKDNSGNTALMWAVIRKNSALVEKILTYCRDTRFDLDLFIENQQGESVLMLSNKHYCEPIFNMLIGEILKRNEEQLYCEQGNGASTLKHKQLS